MVQVFIVQWSLRLLHKILSDSSNMETEFGKRFEHPLFGIYLFVQVGDSTLIRIGFFITEPRGQLRGV